jgi:purine-nucleoside phosphorylase
MLNFKGEAQYYQSTNFLFNYFLSKSNCASLIKANSACVSSLILEQNFSKFFKEKGILIADMESSIVFSSAKDINRNVIVLTYVSDLIGQDFTIKIDDSMTLAD